MKTTAQLVMDEVDALESQEGGKPVTKTITPKTVMTPAQAGEAMDFTSFNLPANLMQSLTRMNFKSPTPIQAQAIPLALAGRDILGSAQTGTGKTGAFSIPLVAKLLEDPKACALVMTPTRELASQVLAAITQMIPVATIKTALLIGGESMPKQFKQLQMRPRIVVGTPGRINDHLTRQTLDLRNTRFLVLDETDRMLDMGFGVQIDKILAYMPKENRQTMMFSATLPPSIVKMSTKYMADATRITVGSTTTPAAKIKQEIVNLPENKKYDQLLEELDKREGSVIVFVKTKHGADRMADKLCRDEHRADAIHGDLQQRKRDRVIQNFRDKKNRILVATDVAARGLDIPHIEHVINYDLPQVPEDYIHRIGRTARAGAEGCAVNFVSPSEAGKWKAIQRLINDGESTEESFRSDSRRPAAKSFGDKKPFGAKKPFGEKKSFGDRKPFGDKKPWGRKEFSNANENRPSRQDRFRDEAPRRDRDGWAPREDRDLRDDNRFGGFGADRKPRGEGRFNNDRAPRQDRFNDDRAPRGDRFGDSRPAPRGDKRFGDRPAPRGENRFGDRPAPRGDGNGPTRKPGGGGFKKRFGGPKRGSY